MKSQHEKTDGPAPENSKERKKSAETINKLISQIEVHQMDVNKNNSFFSQLSI